MFLFRLLSYLPLPALYLITDILYLFGYHVLKYRQKVILRNLEYAFPEKSPKERKQIAKKFFRNLTDSFAETLKLFTMGKNEIKQRFRIEHPEIIKERLDNGEIVLGLTAHFFHWEGQVLAFKAQVDSRMETVYTKVNNAFFENLMKRIRSRFGGFLVEKSDFTRHYLKERNTVRLIGLAADQRPGNRDIRYWTEFMHRETAFYEGPEKMAKRYGHPVVFAKVTKPKRGHYVYNYQLLDAPPYNGRPEHSITDKFIRLTEENIRTEPALYLWSHNRWKWKKGE
ncbi:lysophospholipid acyltransferase family protein [Cecembia calidifontis]|jgi:KDO2-lipid IV(A) lauroyltransferase|uniref:KDO2-lipid IV(A) lauroyltransferase n=1 Tax=Cecembia calidifontis TaxID=1187080 RepID=A0A4Q7P494_9BACT|nr:lipid A biosynthesis acyltransferase [Cecembia calidifontis]RZS94776.1 KDO2-lipid IV(A) lauroyltransferase [Cecembia calidifontis]